MTESTDQSDTRGLRKLRYDDWAMAAQARLGKRGLWDVICAERRRRVGSSIGESRDSEECESAVLLLC